MAEKQAGAAFEARPPRGLPPTQVRFLEHVRILNTTTGVYEKYRVGITYEPRRLLLVEASIRPALREATVCIKSNDEGLGLTYVEWTPEDLVSWIGIQLRDVLNPQSVSVSLIRIKKWSSYEYNFPASPPVTRNELHAHV
jgi:hypothetical protein